ncbi:DUF2569 family protein [Sphingomonas sp.]|uniref:DUF2569 family protein n=1 Tax=Sphingomonas sp. TaxID=28214 RepID=UPI00286BFEC0|nr:DUF2569 family protein [Sphingomonas sp.]
MFDSMTRKMHAKSAALLVSIESSLDRIMIYWLLVAGLVAAARIWITPIPTGIDAGTIAPYVLLIIAPFASMVLALRWFHDGDRLPQPIIRLARVSKWRSLDRLQALRHPLYGAGGIMVSLLIGMLLNVPVRAVEYFAAMPPIAGPVPQWLDMLRFMMTLDVVLMSSLYCIAFVAALRRVPLFPRLLVAIWALDLAIQVGTGQLVASMADLPATVADALQPVLTGNIKKTMISIVLWMPYLLLSTRVNVTYRHRVPA